MSLYQGDSSPNYNHISCAEEKNPTGHKFQDDREVGGHSGDAMADNTWY